MHHRYAFETTDAPGRWFDTQCQAPPSALIAKLLAEASRAHRLKLLEINTYHGIRQMWLLLDALVEAIPLGVGKLRSLVTK